MPTTLSHKNCNLSPGFHNCLSSWLPAFGNLSLLTQVQPKKNMVGMQPMPTFLCEGLTAVAWTALWSGGKKFCNSTACRSAYAPRERNQAFIFSVFQFLTSRMPLLHHFHTICVESHLFCLQSLAINREEIYKHVSFVSVSESYPLTNAVDFQCVPATVQTDNAAQLQTQHAHSCPDALKVLREISSHGTSWQRHSQLLCKMQRRDQSGVNDLPGWKWHEWSLF